MPKIDVHAFCELKKHVDMLQSCAEDKQMSGFQFELYDGGLLLAIDTYSGSRTPDLLVLESGAIEVDKFLQNLDRLAECCDVHTKVIVLASAYDKKFHVNLLNRGVSNYLVTPFTKEELLTVFFKLYEVSESSEMARVVVFLGARGGVGSSTIAQNVAWLVAEKSERRVILADLDLPWGSCASSFGIDLVNSGTIWDDAGAMDPAGFSDELVKCSDRLFLLASPSKLNASSKIDKEAYERMLSNCGNSIVIIDLPHTWEQWTSAVLESADSVILAASLDPTSLRNAMKLKDAIMVNNGPADGLHLVLNNMGSVKPPKLSVEKFYKMLGVPLLVQIPTNSEVFLHAATLKEPVVETGADNELTALFDLIARQVLDPQELSVVPEQQDESSFSSVLRSLVNLFTSRK